MFVLILINSPCTGLVLLRREKPHRNLNMERLGYRILTVTGVGVKRSKSKKYRALYRWQPPLLGLRCTRRQGWGGECIGEGTALAHRGGTCWQSLLSGTAESCLCGHLPEALSLRAELPREHCSEQLLGAAGHLVGAGQKQEVKHCVMMLQRPYLPAGKGKTKVAQNHWHRACKKLHYQRSTFQKHRWNTNCRPSRLREPNYTAQGAYPSHYRAWSAWFSGLVHLFSYAGLRWWSLNGGTLRNNFMKLALRL